MFGKILSILVLLTLLYGVYWVYTKTWPGATLGEAFQPFSVFGVKRATSTKFGLRLERRNWFDPIIPGEIPTTTIRSSQ